MAFLFGKKKGAHGHREGTPNGPIPPAAAGVPGGGAPGGPGGPTPSSSVNNSLNSLAGGIGATSSPDQRPIGAPTGPPRPQQQQQGPSGKQAPGPQQNIQSSQARVIPPPNTLRNIPKIQSPSGVNPANVALYPWSQQRLTLSSSHPSPFPRYGHAANGVAGKDGDIYIMGGLIRSQTVRGDLWMVEGGGTQLSAYPVMTTSEGPGPRVGHASLLVGNAFIVFGGDTKLDQQDVLDETLYLLNTTTRQWSRANPNGPRPAGRYGHTLNILGSKLYIFGGQVDGRFFNDLVAFDLNTLQSAGSGWEVLVPAKEAGADMPASRTNHTIVTWADKLYLFGGTNGVTWFNDVWSYDPRSKVWSQLDCIGYIPSPREGHAAALVGDVMYIFGGRTSEGEDLGDLAAFRISSRRWYTFQNMGPSPSRRSGHSMTTCGQRIIVLGGEPSMPSRNQEELQYIYVLDTAKIRYPTDHQHGSPTDRNHAPTDKRIQGLRSGSVDGPGPGPGDPRSRGAKQVPREGVTASGSPGSTGSTPLASNNTSGSSVNSRLPRASMSQAPAGPPPTQQAPPPKAGGVPPGPRSRTPTGSPGVPVNNNNTRLKDNVSPIQPQPRDGPAGTASGRRTPTAQQRMGSTDVVSGPAPAPQERSRSRQQGPTGQQQQSADNDRSPSTVPNQSPSSQQDNLADGSSTVASPRSPSGTASAPRGLSLAAEGGDPPAGVPEKNSTPSQEMERLKHQNDWYSSELALARRAGYTPQTNGNAILDERANESLAEDDRPFIEAMLMLKGELSRVQGSVDTQAALAAKRIQNIERQRDVAIQEAVYAKAKLAALGGNSAAPTGDKSAVDIANMDAEKMADMSRKLASSLAAQAELSARVEVLTAEITAERKARHLADETAAVAQSRVTELDDFRNRAASEMESLRAELLDAERAFRDEAAARTEATAEAKLLRIDQDELSMKLKEALEDNSSYQGLMGELRKAMESSSERSTTLARQLEEERMVKEGLERKLAQVRSEYEEKVADLTSANTRLRDAEELMEKCAEEARAARAAMAAGLQKVSEREIMSDTGAADERVRVLQDQVASANSLLARSKAQADETGEKLAQAMQRVAGLEFQQGQASKDAIALRRRMAEALDEVRRLKQENAENNARLLDRQLEVDSITTKHNALKEILAERSSMAGYDKRRSHNLQSPSPSGTATPEQINRLRELETRLEESLRAHRETKSTAEMQAQEVEKHFREKLEQLENDYQSAVHYVKGTEKLLKRMKDELAKNKAQNARLHLELEEAQRKNSERSRQGSVSEIGAESWESERASLKREIDDLRTKVRESATALDKQIRESKETLDSLREERDQFKIGHNQLQLQIMDVSQQLSETRQMVERLEMENNQLERRAQDAEERVSFLLDRVEDSVDAYRRSTRLEGASGSIETGSARSSFYGAGPDARNSVALDSLATELDALRTHWENTNKNYRLSSTFDFEKTPTSTEGGELSSSLAMWRQKLQQEESDAARRSDSRGDEARSPVSRSQQQQNHLQAQQEPVIAGGVI
ncbi:unnamed protein product [Tuber aestivum]|uniref:Uncharacterized protein n=1 Tax=Tuber aestivum TaxID=59557 RepID=A0A292PQR4_9PEZI|nr:unnamed protein product [Tuber aestivum]